MSVSGNDIVLPIDAGHLVFSADMLIVGIIGLVVIWRLPRAIARYSTSSPWITGHFLRKVTPKSPFGPPADESRSSSSASKECSRFSDSSHAGLWHRSPSYPLHVPTYWKVVRPLAPTFEMRLIPGYTVGRALILFLYFCCLVYLPFYQSNPLSDDTREGFIAIAQLPFVFLFSAKNNVLSGLLGLGYERLNYIHRFVGRLLVLWIDLHALHFFYQWTNARTFQRLIALPSNTWGMVGFVSVNLILFFSTSFWRRRAYNVFLGTHVIGYTLIIPACWFHKPSMRPYLIAVIVIIAYDRFVRLLKSRFTTAFLRPLPELQCTRIEVPNVNAGWAPGQHVRLRIFSSTMGIFGWSEVHPFTIASVSESHEGLVLLCKNVGGWTSKLFEAAKIGGYDMTAGDERKVRVHVEGPYGGGGHTIFTSYSGALLVSGGSGITFTLSLLQDMIRKDMTNESRVKVIEFVWIVPDPTALSPLLPAFTNLIAQSYNTNLRISIYYTQAPSRELKVPYNPEYFPPNLSIHPGRPKITRILERVMSKIVKLGAPGGKDDLGLTGVLVGCCGPSGLGDECSKAIGLIEPAKREKVGGIELHEETFGL